ncbi:MAG: Histidine kinase [Methanocella sp. PtaU1.Bin125]|nr:MAG: Histidine kinase [Methanocella sp. PtaU1.Bin125]
MNVKTGRLWQKRFSYLLVILEFALAVAIALFFIASITGDFTSVPNILSYSILLLLCIPLCLILYFLSYDRFVRIFSLGILAATLLNIVSGIVWYVIPLWNDEPLYTMAGMLTMILAYVPLIMAMYRVTKYTLDDRGRGFLNLIFAAVAVYAILAFSAGFALSRGEFPIAYEASIFVVATLADLVIISLGVYNVVSRRAGEAKPLFAIITAALSFALIGDLLNFGGTLGFFDTWNVSQVFYTMTFITEAICLLIFSMQTVNTRGISRVRKELFDTRQMMDDFVMQSPDAVCIADAGGNVVTGNDLFLRRFGLDRRDSPGNINLFDSPGLLGEAIHANLLGVRNGDERRSFTVRYDKEKPEYFNVRIFPTRSSDGSVSGYALIAEDVTEKENAVADLKKSQAFYRAVVEDQTELICRFREDGAIAFANEAFRKYFAGAPAAGQPDDFYHYLAEGERAKVRQIVSSLCPEAPVIITETALPANGAQRWMQWTFRAIFGPSGLFIEFQSVGRDITDRMRAEEALKRSNDLLEQRVMERTRELARAVEALHQEIDEHKKDEERVRVSLKEKDILLKEIHHRVKNNLQIISSLLSLQARQVKEQESIDALMESQDRIRSIALIHENLYQSEGLARIDCRSYMEKLIYNLRMSYAPVAENVRIVIDVADVMLDIDRAIPCGLIINELVTNSFKYAFGGECSGDIYVGLHRDPSGTNRLEVRDNGPGLPGGLAIGKTDTLGLQLVYVLVRQLEGKIEVAPGPGACYCIEFSAA